MSDKSSVVVFIGYRFMSVTPIERNMIMELPDIPRTSGDLGKLQLEIEKLTKTTGVFIRSLSVLGAVKPPES